MNKKLVIGIIIVFILAGFFFIYKSTSDKTSIVEPLKNKDLSNFILATEDFPQGEGWTLKDRVERGKTDVSEYGLNLGWKRGYLASYLRGDLNSDNLDYTRVDLYISEYPSENASLVLRTEESDNFTLYDPLSDPMIGDESKAYKVITRDNSGVESISYRIEFRKDNLLYTLFIYGTRTDYTLLKDLAKKVEMKVCWKHRELMEN